MTTAAVAVRERPILMSGPLVRAVLDGRKTQTRRVMLPKPEPWANGWKWHTREQRLDRGGFGVAASDGGVFARLAALRCPYGKPGDRLWVRETWSADFDFPGDDVPSSRSWEEMPAAFRGPQSCSYLYYRADGSAYNPAPPSSLPGTLPSPSGWQPEAADLDRERWRPSIHMPRWASRLTLEITEVRVERLQEISEADAIAEGMEYEWHGVPVGAVESYERLWDSLNAKRGYLWESNPWVFAITFRRVEP